MLDVFITVDVEIWCNSWRDLDERFPRAFRQYIYGSTARGDYGLPYQVELLNQHGLTGVFFVEPLFSKRFGLQPLAEIVGILSEGPQEIELHLHTEWVDESKEPIFKNVTGKRQHLRYFTLKEQETLIDLGIGLLGLAGAKDTVAFRAGSFALNLDTLRALATNRIRFDSSYNATLFGPDSGVMPGSIVVSPIECAGVVEYPMTVYDDGTGSLRHVQLTACSSREIEGCLWQALERGRNSFVLLSHSFELLNQARNRPDDVVVNRFKKLCSFLDQNRDCFRTRGFRNLHPQVTQQQPPPLVSPVWRTAGRIVEQAYRRRFK